MTRATTFGALLLALSGVPALASPTITDELAADLAQQDMTTDELASWMQNVLEGRGHPCSSVNAMAGKVPRVNPEDRRNVMVMVGCEDAAYFIKVGIGQGWTIEPE